MADDGEDKPIRFGIMGCAGIARKVSRAINLAPNSALCAIASRSIEKAKEFAVRNGLSSRVRIYGSYYELLDDPGLDAVYMPLPTGLHVEWAVLAARRKKHLLLEKPAALDLGELDRILEACELNDVQFMDASMWYHHPRTSKMKELLSNSSLLGTIRAIYSSSTFTGTPEFFENNIRVKPGLDALGALGDTGWYCIGAILWAMDCHPPTTVTALPPSALNPAGIILSCTGSLHWEKQETVATFHCSFLSHGTLSLTVCGSKGTLQLQDFIIPIEESSASFHFSSGAKFAELHIGWSAKPQEIWVDSELPQEALMIQEFARLVKGIQYSESRPETKWPQITRVTQLVVDAMRKSMDLGFKPVYL